MRKLATSHGTSFRLAATMAAVIAIGGMAMSARAADYPDHPVTIVVPSAPGGGTDITTRLIAQGLGDNLGQPVVVVNHAGASGNLGAAIVAKAKPDGYTLLAMISSHVINPSLFARINYDVEKDFTPITRTVTVPEVILSNSSMPAKTLPELIAYIKANPNSVNFGSAGLGSLSHLVMEMFMAKVGVSVNHVPYRATAPALADLLANHISLLSPDLTIALPYLKDGPLRAYAVTSAARSPAAPDVPTLAELGVADVEASQWFGLSLPAGAPKPVVDKLYAAIVKTLANPELQARLLHEGLTAAPSKSPEDFAALIHSDFLKWAKVIQESHIAKAQD